MLQPILDVLLDRARLVPGERVLDVGCGTGPSTAAAARAVQPGGTVLGLDLAAELVEVARREVTNPGVDWLVGDAATARLPAGHFDAVLSRFGVMFFGDPRAAFANLARATRTGGRLLMTVWPRRTEVERFTLPYEVARRALDRAGLAYQEPGPDTGPFSLSEESGLRALLSEAGWREIDIEFHTLAVPLGGIDVAVDEVARQSLQAGHAGALLEGQPADIRAIAEQELAEEYAARVTADGLHVNASFRVVAAVRP